ncbi:MAG: DUF433 domain-containing protein [Candidatus Marinimicrobia bacterium]|nr:DUF433 domain-containing protein [Candidatus Neomarinimicrobiota bacterium]
MKGETLLERITMDPKVMVGKPVIRGTRLTVQHMVGLLANGMTEGEILDEYEGLTRDDLRACLLFATRALEDTTFVPTAAGID